MNQLIINLWVIVFLAFTAPHVVEAFVPSHPLFSNDCSISTTSTTIFYSPSGNNTRFRETSELTIEELKRIAFRKGYDTVGMDREGLEMIANFLDVEEDFSVEGDPPEVDEASLAKREPLFGSIPRERERQPSIYDMVPNSYDCLKNPEDAVYADRDMDFDTLESDRNGSENSQPQNQSWLQPSLWNTPLAQFPPKLRFDPNKPLPQSSKLKTESSQIQSESSQIQSESSELQSEISKLQSEISQLKSESSQIQSEPITTTLLKSQSLSAFVVGFITGVVAVSPLTYLSIYTFPSEIIENESSQFLFDTVTSGISAAAFATIYRYFIQPNPNKNDDMKNGIIGTFVLCRSVSRIGTPLGFMDWDMLQQYGLNFFEDLALFGAVALVLEYLCDKGFVSYARDSRRNL